MSDDDEIGGSLGDLNDPHRHGKHVITSGTARDSIVATDFSCMCDQ